MGFSLSNIRWFFRGCFIRPIPVQFKSVKNETKGTWYDNWNQSSTRHCRSCVRCCSSSCMGTLWSMLSDRWDGLRLRRMGKKALARMSIWKRQKHIGTIGKINYSLISVFALDNSQFYVIILYLEKDAKRVRKAEETTEKKVRSNTKLFPNFEAFSS